MYVIVNKSTALLRLSGLGVNGKDSKEFLSVQWATQRCVAGDTLPAGYGFGRSVSCLLISDVCRSDSY
jgi:hypothetical protein